MAVEATLVKALGLIGELIAPNVLGYLRPIWGGVDEDLKKLQRYLRQIQPRIEDAEERQLKDENVKSWLILLRDAAYDAEDILDQANTHVLLIRRKAQLYGPMKSKVRDFFSLDHNPLLFQLRLGEKLRSINKRIIDVIEEMNKFNFKGEDNNNNNNNNYNNRPWRNRPQTHSYVPESEVIGRDEDKEKIVQMLIHDHFEEKLAVISIVGMGGLGKTTLAQLICGDENVKSHFELRIWWVYVSRVFDVEKIARNILLAASEKSYVDTNMEVLQRDLRQLLAQKRYLIVLDDVWNENTTEWDKLRHLLLDGAEGSRILVTTRNENCSRIMGSKKPYTLKGLSEESSWALFEERAFSASVSRQQKLEEIGNKIVSKCEGLPLAIKVMGSVLHSKSEESQWQAVLDNEIWDTPYAENEIRPALWLSYVDLPSQVKKCFSFCAIFPKGSIIKEDLLVQLWMAHGFIPSQSGNEIFDELMGRSLLQNVTNRHAATHYSSSNYMRSAWPLRCRKCKMHDLIHKFAQFVTGDECATWTERHEESMKISKRTRHFIFNPYVGYDMSVIVEVAQSVRTALGFGTEFIGLSKLKFLRVLQLSSVDELPTSIAYLHHLRYLDLSFSHIKELPESICMLVNLQTLNLCDCFRFDKLPMSIVYMSSLIHLDLSRSAVKIMPPGLSKLRCLKTLSKYTVADKAGSKIGELKHWELDDEVELRDLHEVKNADEAKEVNMSSRHKIKSLSLSWGASVENAEQVLEALKPHAALKELVLFGYPGTQFSMWIRDGQLLQNLVNIKLDGCQGCEQLPPFERLPCLKYLNIRRMNGIKYIINNAFGNALSSFPALQWLRLHSMANLEGWCVEEDREETGPPLFPCVHHMTIECCPKLTTMPPQFPVLRQLEITKSYCKAQNTLMSKNKGVFKHLKSLHSLSLNKCEELALLLENEEETRPLSSTLVRLSINGCSSQFSLSTALGNLTSVNKLSISHFGGLVSLPDEMSRGLQELRVSDCGALIELPTCPASLSILSVSDCPRIQSICSDGEHFTSLHELKLYKCPILESLPEGMQDLTSLRRLEIIDCPALKSIPEGLHQRLPALGYLTISGCPELQRRYGPGGDYFHLLSNISSRIIESSSNISQRDTKRSLKRRLLAPCCL